MPAEPQAVGPVTSQFVLQLVGKCSEYAMGEDSHKPSAVASQYAVEGLENIMTLESNPFYQRHPLAFSQFLQSRHVIPGAGNPISASKLKQKVANLEDKVYIPAVVGGALYFISSDDDTHTAREGVNEPNDPIFLLSQLKEIFGEDFGNKLTDVKAGQVLSDSLRNALSYLKKHHTRGPQAICSNSEVTPLSSPWNTPTKAASCIISTGAEKSDNVLGVASEELLISSETDLKITRQLSTTDIPVCQVTHRPSKNLKVMPFPP